MRRNVLLSRWTGLRACLALLALPFACLDPSASLAAMGDFTAYASIPEGIVVTAGADSLVFRFYAADVVRVDFRPSGAQPAEPSGAVIRAPSSSVAFTVRDDPDSLALATAGLEVRMSKFPVRVSFSAPGGGGARLAEPASAGVHSAGSSREAAFEYPTALRLRGSGERGIGPDLRGHSFGTWNTQQFGYSGPLETMNINVPFLTSSSEWALFFESPRPATMDFGVGSPGVFSYEISGGELSYFVLIAPDVPDQIERYTWLTGRQPLPPKWALGYLQSKFGYRNRAAAESMVSTMRAKGIPADAIILDLYWFSDMGDLAWNTAAFPDPAGMIAAFRNQGFKTIVIAEPYFTQFCDHYPFLTGAGSEYVGQTPCGAPYELPGWWSCGCDAVLFDVTNPSARSWLWTRYESFLDAGVAGLWTDLGEPESHPGNMQHAGGGTSVVHNVYNLQWSQLVYDGLTSYRPDERPVNLTRSGYAGSQRYGVFTWSGDVSRSFGGLAAQLVILLNTGLSGLGYHGSDLGGFVGTASAEVYTRWMQFGVFNPVMRAHGVDNQPTEPWGFGPQTEAIVSDYIRLRYRLLPYIYSLARENHETGMPLARPLFFLDPDDASLANRSDAYLFGPDFLVAPVVSQGQTQKTLDLPGGQWMHYWTDSLYTGGTSVTVSASLESLPLFSRAGAIIPMQPVTDFVGQTDADTLLLDVFPPLPGRTETFTLYEDDGESRDYEQQEFAKIPLSQRLVSAGGETGLELTVGAAQGGFPEMIVARTVVATVRGVAGPPPWVTLDADTLAAYGTEAELLQAGDGHFHDATRGRLLIKFEHDMGVAARVTIAGLSGTTGVGETPSEVALLPARPNPFRDRTTIDYRIPAPGGRATLSVHDVSGRLVKVVVDRWHPPGAHQATWDGTDRAGRRAAAGVYVYRLEAAGITLTRKISLVR